MASDGVGSRPAQMPRAVVVMADPVITLEREQVRQHGTPRRRVQLGSHIGVHRLEQVVHAEPRPVRRRHHGRRPAHDVVAREHQISFQLGEADVVRDVPRRVQALEAEPVTAEDVAVAHHDIRDEGAVTRLGRQAVVDHVRDDRMGTEPVGRCPGGGSDRSGDQDDVDGGLDAPFDGAPFDGAPFDDAPFDGAPPDGIFGATSAQAATAAFTVGSLVSSPKGPRSDG